MSASQHHRLLRQRYERVFDAAVRVVERWDPLGVLGDEHPPQHEYDDLAAELTRQRFARVSPEAAAARVIDLYSTSYWGEPDRPHPHRDVQELVALIRAEWPDETFVDAP